MTHQIRSQESSVVFNLRQLMQLEQERVAHERALREAEQEAEAEARAQHERRKREEVERARAEAEAAALRTRAEVELGARAETERQAALLRVRLEAEAAERRQQAERELVTQHSRARFKQAAVCCGVVAALGGAVFAYPHQRQAAPAGSVATPAQPAVSRDARHAADQAREIAALRKQLDDLLSRPAEPRVSPTPLSAAKSGRPASRQARTANPRSNANGDARAAAALDDLGDERDPLGGLRL